MRNILDAHYVVRDDFINEDEVRFLIHTFGPHGQLLYGQEGPKGQLMKWRLRRTTPPIHECVGGYCRRTAILLQVDGKQLIDEIVIGKHASSELLENLEKRALIAGLPFRREGSSPIKQADVDTDNAPGT